MSAGTNVVPMPAPQAVTNVAIDQVAVLRSLNLDPNQPAVQALILVCQQYQLDPVLKHMILISGNPYVTHKGLWHIAHRSGLLDGWEVIDQGESTTEWWAKVTIRRKDMAGGWTMTGRYPKNGTNKTHGPEMAVTRADCLILRRMFDVSLTAAEEFDGEPVAFNAPSLPRTIDAGTGEVVDPDPIASEKFQKGWFAQAKKLGIDGDDADEVRHAIVHYATGGKATSIKAVRVSQTKAVAEATEAYGRGELVLTYDPNTDQPTLAPKDAAPLAEPVQSSFAPGEEPF